MATSSEDLDRKYAIATGVIFLFVVWSSAMYELGESNGYLECVTDTAMYNSTGD